MSCFIHIDPQIQSEPEPEGQEFGYYTFDQLPALEIHDVQMSSTASPQHNPDVDLLCELPIHSDMLVKLQQEDMFCKNIFHQIEKANIMEGQLYKIDKKLLKRFVIDGNDTYEATVIPRSLIPQVLHMAHNKLGHNGTHRTYILLK